MWHGGLLVMVVTVLTGCYGVAQWFVGVGFCDSFFDVTTNLSRYHGCVTWWFVGVGGDGDGCYGVAQQFVSFGFSDSEQRG